MTRARALRSAGRRGGPGPRILGGSLRGRRLTVAPLVRPTESRLREALFSIWQDRVLDCRFLDLFAGSGAVGLEAASRGAREIVFAEQSSRVLATLRRNVDASTEARLEVWRRRLPEELARTHPEREGIEPFELIFADPPYEFDRYPQLLQAAEPWLAGGGELAIEHSRRVQMPAECASLSRIDQRCYGDACFSFYQTDSLG
ncbi:MAG: 16S rRNA (guanine(966)-N(2))-methyltransferase RsmD [Acidobacteriota bacterium]